LRDHLYFDIATIIVFDQIVNYFLELFLLQFGSQSLTKVVIKAQSWPGMATLKILTAEDNPDDVVLLEHALKKARLNSRLIAVSDGVEALSYLKGEGAFADRRDYPFPDMLLLDLNMPRMNGFEVLQWVRADKMWGRLMVHVLTASSRQSDVERAYDLHANSYTVKPIRLDELVAFFVALHDWYRFVIPARPKS
jgi:CheY-like chemotaxis protein